MTNYWFETCPTEHRVESGLVRNTDVLIVGGGIAGVSLLYTLLNCGVKNVLLVEESTIGYRASGRGNGHLQLRGATLFSEMNDNDGADYLNFILENNKRVRRGLRIAPFDTDIRECGGLRLAGDETELARLTTEREFIVKHSGVEAIMLATQDVQTLIPDSPFIGGMYIPTEITFNPYKVVNGMRENIEKRGQYVLTNCRVDKVENTNNRLSVSIRNRGTILAKTVVYCTNAYTYELLPQLENFMTPIRGQMSCSDLMVDGKTLPIMGFTFNNGSEYARMHNGRLLAGGKRESVRGKQIGLLNDGEVSPTVFDNLKEFVGESFPSLKNDVKFSRTWTGVMCETPDGLPLIGNVPGSNVEYIMAGFNGYGFSHAFQASLIIKDLIARGESTHRGAKLFNPGRFSNHV